MDQNRKLGTGVRGGGEGSLEENVEIQTILDIWLRIHSTYIQVPLMC